MEFTMRPTDPYTSNSFDTNETIILGQDTRCAIDTDLKTSSRRKATAIPNRHSTALIPMKYHEPPTRRRHSSVKLETRLVLT
jgi:hypothetical protein